MSEFRGRNIIRAGLAVGLAGLAGLSLSACGNNNPNEIGACPQGWASREYEVPSGQIPNTLAAIFTGQHALAASVPQSAMFGYGSKADEVDLSGIPNGPQEQALRTVFSREGTSSSVFLGSPLVGTPATAFCKAVNSSVPGESPMYISPVALNTITALEAAGIEVQRPGQLVHSAN